MDSPTDTALEALRALAAAALSGPTAELQPMPGGGSRRDFYRITGGAGGHRVVGVVGRDLAEVRAFLGFTAHFEAQGLPVPRVLAQDAARGLYVMEDLGEATLSETLAAWRAQPGAAARAEAALQTLVRRLPEFQFRATQGMDAALYPPSRVLGAATFRADLERFLTHYVPRFVLRPAPLTPALGRDLETLVLRLDGLPRAPFCYRDYQTRNIMWVRRGGDSEHGPVFLDYQGGLPGPPAYDLAALLYSPDSGADEALRVRLTQAYVEAAQDMQEVLSPDALLDGFDAIVLIRRLQALGAYAELGVARGKAVYLERIPPALDDLRALYQAGRLDFGLPALHAWLGVVLEV